MTPDRTAERWRRIDDLFARGLELDGDARRRLLEDVGEEDPELRRELESLLAVNDDAGAFMEREPSRLNCSCSTGGRRAGGTRMGLSLAFC